MISASGGVAHKADAAYLDNRRILFAPFYELIVCQLRILITIHVTEDLLDPLQTVLATEHIPRAEEWRAPSPECPRRWEA